MVWKAGSLKVFDAGWKKETESIQVLLNGADCF
jgi:hypothetical protein